MQWTGSRPTPFSGSAKTLLKVRAGLSRPGPIASIVRGGASNGTGRASGNAATVGKAVGGMISFDEALNIVIDVAKPLAIERLRIGEAHRRVLAEPVVARVDSPPSDVSTMDGYAVRDEDLLRLPARLRVVGESFAGSGFGGEFGPGCCIRILTGAPLPKDADRVVVQEAVHREGDLALISVHPGATSFIRLRGSDFERGTLLIEAGRRLDYRSLVAAAAADLALLAVWRRPDVLVLTTGDELAEPGLAAEKPGFIPESVSLGVAALADDWGAAVKDRIHLRDELETMTAATGRALELADLVVVTGGASVGDKDFAKAMFEGHGLELLFSKVAMKPGKPVWLGRAKGRLVLGLPGNPTSALVTARLLMAPLVAGLSGLDPESALRWRTAALLESLPACGDRETFIRARTVCEAAEPMSNQDSGAQETLIDADVLVRRRSGAPAAVQGDSVQVIDF